MVMQIIVVVIEGFLGGRDQKGGGCLFEFEFEGEGGGVGVGAYSRLGAY